MKTLIVEDDPVTALYVTEGLRTLGHTVYWAPTGPDGLEQARHGDCTLIIVDRMLPGLDGLSLVKQLRERNIQTPVLFLTTMDDLDARVEGLNAGGDDYLTKPFALSELLARANAIIRRQNHFEDASVQTRLRMGELEMDLLSARLAGRPGDRPAAAGIQAARISHAQRRPRDHAHHAAGESLGAEFRPGNERGRDSHMSRLRSKVDRGFATELIRTIREARLCPLARLGFSRPRASGLPRSMRALFVGSMAS